jgi:hypothetical protein
MAEYDVFPLDLSAVTTSAGVDLVPAGVPVAEINILDVPGGGSFQISYARGPWITITKGYTAEPSGPTLPVGGVRWRNLNALPGVLVEFIVFYGEASMRTVVL